MTGPNDAFLQKLRAIFADEARVHLQQIEAALLAVERAGDKAAPGMVEPALRALHTLKGAARAVDLDHLERLCHALEGACAAARAVPGALVHADFDRLNSALACARELTGPHTGRVRNQASALSGQLDQMAQRLAQLPRAGAPAGTDAAPLAGTGADQDSEAAGADPPPTPAAAMPEMVRVDAARLDAIRTEAEALLAVELALQHQAGEVRALAQALGGDGQAAAPGDMPAGAMAAELRCARLAQQLGATAAALAATRKRLMGNVLDTALVPFAAAVDELPALVRKLARGRGHEADLVLEGEGVQLDRRVLGVIREALVHLVTNAVDHGIEAPDRREAAGKPRAGQVRVAAAQRDARHVLVRVADDGPGLDPGALARAAARGGGLDPGEAERLDTPARLQLALRAGVSTRAEVTPVSGRGMGLAIVADKVAAVGGTLAIDSAPGCGAAFELLLPVSLASMRALVVRAGVIRCAVPLAGLDSVRAVAPGDIGTVESRETLAVDGRVLPLVRLAALFGAAPGPQAGVALLAASAQRPFALLVDAIVAEQDVLPRRLGPLLRRVRGVSGATELGDGALVPLLALDDLADLKPQVAAGAWPDGGAAAARVRRVLVAEDSITSRLLLKHILEGAGYSVETAADGMEALSHLRQGRFDAVVSDVEMPHMDGLALTEAIRANAMTAELPVILVTSLQTEAERASGLQAGADAYLTKGAFDQDQLLAAVRRLA